MTELLADPTLRPWLWLVSGLLLLGLELLTTTTLLLWPALGGMVTGVLLFALPGLPTSWQIILFGLVALSTALIGRRIIKRHRASATPIQPLNTPEAGLIGRTIVARPPDNAGRGSVVVDGIVWSARLNTGQAPPGGQSVRVLAVDGATLIVETITASGS